MNPLGMLLQAPPRLTRRTNLTSYVRIHKYILLCPTNAHNMMYDVDTSLCRTAERNKAHGNQIHIPDCSHFPEAILVAYYSSRRWRPRRRRPRLGAMGQ